MVMLVSLTLNGKYLFILLTVVILTSFNGENLEKCFKGVILVIDNKKFINRNTSIKSNQTQNILIGKKKSQ